MWRKIKAFAKEHHQLLEWWAEIILCVAAAIGWAIALIFLVTAKWGV